MRIVGTLRMNDVLSHAPGGPRPWALDSANAGLQRRTKKSSLAKESVRRRQHDMIPLSCGRIIDGMIMVQKITGNEKTIAEVAGSMMSMGLHEGTDSHRLERIEVVLDVYRDNLINNSDREKGGSKSGHIFRILKADHKIHRWWQFLFSSYNKLLLIKFISEEWQKRGTETGSLGRQSM